MASTSNVLERLRRTWQRAGWGEFVLVFGVGVFCLALWIFIELADDAPDGDFEQIENQILLAFRQPDNPAESIGPHWLPEVGRDVTALGSAIVLTLVTVLVVGFILLRGRRRSAVLVLLATAGGYAVNSGLKTFFGRDRPTVVPHLVEELSLSFPSGHSMVGAATYLTLGVLLAQTVARRREKIYFVLAALFIGFIVGTSRVYLGVHYPTDVLAGWAVGTAWALFCWGVAAWLQRRGALRTPREEDGLPEPQPDELEQPQR